MDGLCKFHFSDIVRVLLLIIMTVATAGGQSLSARLELEAVSTEEFGRVLSIKTIVKNEKDHDVFLNNFLMSLQIERLNEKNQFEDYFDYWFVRMMHDSNRRAIQDITGVWSIGHDGRFDKPFIRELNAFNSKTTDSTALYHWVKHQVDRIETIKSNESLQFETSLNGLPMGRYRFRYFYSNLVDAITIVPVEKYKMFRFRDRLLAFTRWRGEIDSGYMYLTIR